ncbi:MAG TPA: hypothetical protein VGO59_18775 [Verrucomicrobiae bacterium]|jgi:hypothetical protein
MNQTKAWCAGLVLFALASRAQPILVYPQGVYSQGQAFAGASLSNLRVRNESTYSTEMILTVDFSYDGLHGSSARIVPVITDKKTAHVSRWFGANPVLVGTGRGTISFPVKFFNDEPGAPSELTTDHVKILMLTEGANTLISQGIFARSLKWGGTPAAASVAAPLANAASAEAGQAEEKARQEAAAKTEAGARLKALADERARQEAAAKRLAEEQSAAEAAAKARTEAEASRLAEEKAKAEADAKALEAARQKAEVEEHARKEAAARQLAFEKERAAFTLAPGAKSKIVTVDLLNRNFDRTEMVVSVQYQYNRADRLSKMGVDVTSGDEPGVSTLFSSALFDLAGGTRGIALFPIKLDAPAAQRLKRPMLLTDKVWIYLTDGNGAKSYIHEAAMGLLWRISPEIADSTTAAAPASASPQK